GRSSTLSSSVMSRSESPADSGSSATEEALRRPPPQPGRRAPSSGRDGHTNIAGPCTRSARSSSRSSSTGSAQWMSSMTVTTGVPTLAAPRPAEGGPEVRAAVPDAPPVDAQQHLQLGVPPHHGGGQPGHSPLDADAGFLDHAERDDGLGLPLEVERAQFLVAE